MLQRMRETALRLLDLQTAGWLDGRYRGRKSAAALNIQQGEKRHELPVMLKQITRPP